MVGFVPGRGDFDDEEWLKIRMDEKASYYQAKGEFIQHFKREAWELFDNFKFERKLIRHFRKGRK